MSRSSRPPRASLLFAVVAVAMQSPGAAAAPRPSSPAGPAQALPGAPGPEAEPAPASSFVGRLVGSANIQGAVDVDLGVITSVRHIYSTANQSIAISASKGGKNNLCFIQFNAIAMAENRPGWTRAEPIETYREVVAAARTPGGQVLCVAPVSTESKGSIGRVLYDGTFVWVVLGGKSWHEFQIIVP